MLVARFEKDQLAGLDILRALDGSDHNISAVDGFAPDDFQQVSFELRPGHETDREGGVGIGKGVRRTLHVFRKIVKIERLNLVLRERRRIRGPTPAKRKQR